MPDSYGGGNAAAWNTAATLMSTAANNWAAADLSKKQRKFAEEQAKIQRQQALDDWNMQNAYNDPSAQMSRLRKAGLNPMLIYGKGAGDMTSGLVRSTDQPKWDPGKRDFSGAARGLESYFSMKMMQAQLDNLKTQNTVMLEEAALKRAQALGIQASTVKTGVDTKSAQFDLDLKSELRSISAQAATENLAKLQIDNKYTLDRNEREVAQNAQSIAESVERIAMSRFQRRIQEAKSKEEIANLIEQRNQMMQQMKSEGMRQEMMQFEIDLQEKGVTKNDPVWFRILSKIFDQLDLF